MNAIMHVMKLDIDMSDDNSTIVEKVAKLKSAITDLKNNLSTIGLIDGNEPLSSYAETISSNFDSEEIKDVILYTTADNPYVWQKSKNFTFNQSNGLISEFAEKNIASQIIFPKTVNDVDVKVIANGELSSLTSLTYVSIPNTLTSLGLRTFKDSINLTEIKIPDDAQILSLRADVFHNCYKLKNINIPNTVNTIEKLAFHNCSSLTSITIPENMTMLSSHCFRGCSNLEYMKISTRTTVITNIDEKTFDNCQSLSCVKVLSSSEDTDEDIAAFKNSLIDAGINENANWIIA